MAKKVLSLKEIVKAKPILEKEDHKSISHSQYTIYKNCPYQWYLRYVEKIRPFTSSMNTVFGTAMHEVLQEYLRVMYEESGVAADKLPIVEMLHEKMAFHYSEEKKKNEDMDFSSLEEITEFYEDGLSILKWFKSHRKLFFSSKGIELLGIEVHISQPIESNPNVFFDGYIDLIIYDKDLDTIYIYDFKTSKKGWSDKYEKRDESKIDQILWYKKYFSKQYEIDEDKIKVVFFILKRKIYENSEYPQPRVQVFRPTDGKLKMNKASHNMNKFVQECFTSEGDYNLNREYLKNPSEKSCKFCPFNNIEELCNKIN